MATYTSNLSLKKPAGTEDINVADINGNTDILDKHDVASVFGSGENNFAETSITLYNCTGTIGLGLRYHIAGDLCLIEGRLSISNYTRTGANPGFTIYFPNSKKSKKRVNIGCAGLTSNANGVRAGEIARFMAEAGGTTFKIDTTESYTNFDSNSRAVFQIFPIIVELTT